MTREEAKELLIHILMTYEPKDQYGDYDDPEPYEQALTMAIEALSANAVQEWIPCSERLPSESGWYVVSVVGFENITDVSYFYSDESKWSDVSHTQSVVAWQPLPTPYKGGDDE